MKILIAGAGGAPSEGVINSLLQSKKQEEILGMGAEVSDLMLSNAKRKFYVPYADTENYGRSLITLLNKEKPDLVHFQNDLEIYHASKMRQEILETGTKMFMPRHEVIDRCVHKYKSYEAFSNAGITVPENIMLNNEDDLARAFSKLADDSGKIWIRASSIGGGGKGAIPTANFQLAKAWIEHYDGWGDFVAAQMLTKDTVTWLSIWYEGELIVAQGRKRQGWTHANRAISGVTGVTKVGVTCDDKKVTEVAKEAIYAVDKEPHGIYGVDMAYDTQGVPNPTEINISRFFTTILFFTEAGLNMPEIFKDLALYGEKPALTTKINPLKNDLLWTRGMDAKPKLFENKDASEEITFL